MKTTVFGLFDEMADARRVLEQLVGSPLDLDGITVLHRDADTQRALRCQVGLPLRRTLGKASLVGALVGAAAGAALGADALAGLGPLLAAGLGLPIGAALGAAAAAVSDDTRLPRSISEELLAAVLEGATLVSVRTAGAPTAHAVRDLFEAGGSRLLSSAEDARCETGVPPAPTSSTSQNLRPPADPTGPIASTGLQESEEHALFAPPWRRTPFAAMPRGGYPPEEPDPDFPPDLAAGQAADSAETAAGPDDGPEASAPAQADA